MKNSPKTILVVTPYTQRFGIAVFKGEELLHFAVMTFQRPRTTGSIEIETTKKMKALMNVFMPSLVVMKSLTKLQAASENHRQVAKVVSRIMQLATVPIKEISFEEARYRLVTGKRPTKGRTFEVIEKIYPELSRFMHFQNRHQSEYYTPMLSAVTIGFIQARLRIA